MFIELEATFQIHSRKMNCLQFICAKVTELIDQAINIRLLTELSRFVTIIVSACYSLSPVSMLKVGNRKARKWRNWQTRQT